MNIYEKMLAITSELTKVAKNLQVGDGKYSYKAVGEADVLAAVRPLEEKYKVYSYPFKRTVIDNGEIESTGYNGQVKKQLFLRVETIYRFVNTEKTDEFIDIITYGDGIDSQDKAVGKAMTYGDKYALMKAYKIMTGDDPDQNPSDDLKGKTKPTYQKPAQPQQAPKVAVATKDQLAFINGLEDKLKVFACKKFNLAKVEDLTQEQAQYIIDSLTKKENK